MKKSFLVSLRKRFLTIFLAVLLVLLLPQTTVSLLGSKTNLGFLPLLSFRAHAQAGEGFFGRLLDPIRKFFSLPQRESGLPDLEVTDFNYLGEDQSDPNRVWFKIKSNGNHFSDSDPTDDVVVRLYGHEGDEYPYAKNPLAELAIPKGVLEESLTTGPFSYKDNIRNLPDLSQCVALELCVDDENSVSESNEENNCLFQTFGDCWKCYENKCKDGGVDFCLGATSETWQREDMEEFSVGSYGDAIYADWIYNPVVYRTSERKEVYQIPFQLCINNEGFSGENSWVNGPHSLTGRGGDVLGETDNDVGAKPEFVGSAFRTCSTSYFTIKMRDLNEWASDINYASATLFSAHGAWRNIVFVIGGQNLVVRKFVDGQPGNGWDFKAEITDPTDGSVFLDRDGNLTNTKTTDEDGEAGFNIVYTPDRDTATARITEVPNPEQQSDYELVRAFCQDEDGNEVGVPDLGGYAVESVPTEINKKVECSFFNVSPRKIIVEKYIDSDPNPVGGWEITPSVSATSGIPDAKVKPLSTQSTTATFIAFPDFDRTARVTLVENVKSGHEFVSAQCYYPGAPQDNNLNPVVGAGEITIEITYIDTNPNHKIINCRFNNTRKTTITVEKYIDGEGPKEGWLITPYIDENGTINPPDPQFTTSGADGHPLSFYVFPSIGAVTKVTLTETVQSGYEFVSVACEYQGGTTVEGDNAQITVPIDYTNPHHGIINCRFNNTRKTTITVEKYIDGEGPKEGWRIAPIVINGTITPPHPQLTTSDSPLTYKVYPEIGKKTQVTLTETLKRDYYEFDRVTCEYQDGTTVDGANSQITFPVDYSNPNHGNIKCRFNNKTLPSKIGNLKMSFDYKDCVGVPYTPLPEVMKVISTADNETMICRHNRDTLNTQWLNWDYDENRNDCYNEEGNIASWGTPQSVWASGVPGVYAGWTDTGFIPDGTSTPPYGQWYFIKKDGDDNPKVIQATGNEQQSPWTRDFVRKKFEIPSDRKVVSAKLYTASDNLVKFWLKKSDSTTIYPLIGEGYNLDNNGNTEYMQDSQEESGIHVREVDLSPGEYVLGANLLNWRPFYNSSPTYPGDTHPMGIQFELYIKTELLPEFCNARDDNRNCANPRQYGDLNVCDCIQNPKTHVVDCDKGVDVNEGWKYTWDNNVQPIRITAVLPGGVTGNIRDPLGVSIPTNSETYEIEVNWSDIWREGLWGDLIPRNCNPQDPSNPNNSPFCHVYKIGFDVDLELHARKLSVQIMNPQGPGWIDIGNCTQPDSIASPNTYSCDLSNALLTGDIPDLHQDYIKLRFTFKAPCCGGNNEDGICPDDIICGEECTILIDGSNDSDCCCNYDLYQDGVIDGRDCGRIATIGDDRYGTRPGDPGYDPFYDVNSDGVIDHGDVQLCISSCNEKRCDERFNPILSLSFQKGDANNDNKIDNLDYAVWLASYMKSRGADFSGDGATNERDYVVWWKNYGGKTL